MRMQSNGTHNRFASGAGTRDRVIGRREVHAHEGRRLIYRALAAMASIACASVTSRSVSPPASCVDSVISSRL